MNVRVQSTTSTHTPTADVHVAMSRPFEVNCNHDLAKVNHETIHPTNKLCLRESVAPVNPHILK